MTRLSLDTQRLQRDLAHLRDTAPVRGSGSLALVRAHLDVLDAMRCAGARWTDIAAALAAQGVTQGAGETAGPLTGRRLTALIASIRRQAERRAMRTTAAAVSRAMRSDRPLEVPSAATQPAPPPGTVDRRPRLSPDLTETPVAGVRPIRSEAERRDADLARALTLLKKD